MKLALPAFSLALVLGGSPRQAQPTHDQGPSPRQAKCADAGSREATNHPQQVHGVGAGRRHPFESATNHHPHNNMVDTTPHPQQTYDAVRNRHVEPDTNHPQQIYEVVAGRHPPKALTNHPLHTTAVDSENHPQQSDAVRRQPVQPATNRPPRAAEVNQPRKIYEVDAGRHSPKINANPPLQGNAVDSASREPLRTLPERSSKMYDETQVLHVGMRDADHPDECDLAPTPPNASFHTDLNLLRPENQGQCVEWAEGRFFQLTRHMADFVHGIWADAREWGTKARLAPCDGWHVTKASPSILVLQPEPGAGGPGHVAVVESVDGDWICTSNWNSPTPMRLTLKKMRLSELPPTAEFISHNPTPRGCSVYSHTSSKDDASLRL